MVAEMDLSLTDSYDEFKRKWDLENKKRIINYDELKKEQDSVFLKKGHTDFYKKPKTKNSRKCSARVK